MGRKTSTKRKGSRSTMKRALLSKKQTGNSTFSTARKSAYEQFASAELDAVASLSASGIDEKNKFDLRRLAGVLGSFNDFKGTNYRLRITPKQVQMLHAVRFLLEEAASSVEKSLKNCEIERDESEFKPEYIYMPLSQWQKLVELKVPETEVALFMQDMAKFRLISGRLDSLSTLITTATPITGNGARCYYKPTFNGIAGKLT